MARRHTDHPYAGRPNRWAEQRRTVSVGKQLNAPTHLLPDLAE
ncbi:hypothetical protein BZL30_2381 [Mycobacterium kansasii]|uniref:Uncharacterized protein n=1 Tax=Mycobacterium kansasii TaxID=1768 RepID=A0A1V3XGJ2_MYCKA|nr:hypothetical protein BZL30_2381 [Mycobacterium kansasii]